MKNDKLREKLVQYCRNPIIEYATQKIDSLLSEISEKEGLEKLVSIAENPSEFLSIKFPLTSDSEDREEEAINEENEGPFVFNEIDYKLWKQKGYNHSQIREIAKKHYDFKDDSKLRGFAQKLGWKKRKAKKEDIFYGLPEEKIEEIGDKINNKSYGWKDFLFDTNYGKIPEEAIYCLFVKDNREESFGKLLSITNRKVQKAKGGQISNGGGRKLYIDRIGVVHTKRKI